MREAFFIGAFASGAFIVGFLFAEIRRGWLAKKNDSQGEVAARADDCRRNRPDA
jgi:hypothetical protein